jgi:hypothetical protein
MAQSGFTPIQIYSSSTSGNAPAAGNLLNSTGGAELAINIFDGKLFYKDSSGNVQVIGWKVVPVSAGGTGQTSYTDGQLLIGNSTGNTLTKATLTAGSGVSITNGAGAITISATGGTGDVVGPASATDNAIVRFDTTTGKLIQNSTVTISDNGDIQNVNAAGFDITPTTLPTAQGTLYWDNADAIQTLSLVMEGGNAVQQIGEEQYYRIKCSAAITEGQVIMFTGTVGASGGLTGAPATGLTAATASYVMGVATESGALNDWIYVTSFGLVRNINTTGGAEAWIDGEILYYNPAVTGGLTKTLPTAPNAKIQVCAVVHAASNGSLFIRPTFGGILGQYEGDVGFTSTAAGNLIRRNAGNTAWENVTTIPNTNLANSIITINGVSTSLGGSISVGTVTSVGGTGTVNGITLTGTVTSSGNLTLGGTLSGIGNSQLTNSTISGVALGGSLFNLTAGTGVSFSTGTTYNGSAAITINATGTGGTVTSVAALTLGTTGTDLSSTVANGTTTPVITLNVPTASAANRGALSSTDWSTFNGKQAALVSGTNIKTVSGVSLLGSGDVGTIGTAYGGTGRTSYTANSVVYASSTSALASSSALYFDGTNLGVGGAPTTVNPTGYRQFNVGATIPNGAGILSNGNDTYLTSNSYYDNGAGSFKYALTTAAAAYNVSSGAHLFKIAASGAANATFNFTTAMQIANSGGVSIGNTTDPGATNLSVTGSIMAGTSTPGYGKIAAFAPTGVHLFLSNSTYFDQYLKFTEGTGYTIEGNYGVFIKTGVVNNAYPIKFAIGSTEGARFDGNSYLLVGYTTSNGAYKLQVNSQIFATSSTIATSDGRYKENVAPIQNALDLVNKLNPVSFDWKKHPIHNFDTETTAVGFIAQEVQEALKGTAFVNSIVKKNECTLEAEIFDQETKTVTTEAVKEEFLGIAEGNMIAILTKALQELNAKFDAYVASHP